MKSISTPSVISVRLPTLTKPRLVKMSQSLLFLSFGSGLCNQSSFSTSSGNSNKPAEGRMLYFSETVCVLTSSSLPAREGALESSKGFVPAESLLSRLLAPELQLLLLDDIPDGGIGLDGDCDSSSLNLCAIDLAGGSSNSAESWTAGVL